MSPDLSDGADTPSESIASYIRRLWEREQAQNGALSMRALLRLQDDPDAADSVKLATFSDTLKGKSFPTWDTTRRIVLLLNGDQSEARIRWQGQTRRVRATIENLDKDVPSAMFRWDRWFEMAELAAVGASAKATRDGVGTNSIEREVEQLAFDWAEENIEREVPGTQLFVIVGRRGSGKSYGLFRTAHKLADAGYGDRIYVAHDPVSLGAVNLDSSSLHGGDHPIVLIDDADTSEALGPILRTLQVGNAIVILTASSTRFIDYLKLHSSERGSTFYELPEIVQEREFRKLGERSSAIRVLNRRERADLGHANIATVSRILFSPTETTKSTQEIRNMLGTSAFSDAIATLAMSASRGIPMPRTVLTRLLGQPSIPDELESWIVRESVPGGEQVLWFADSASTASLQLYFLNDMGPKAYQAYVEQLVLDLMGSLESDNQTHRSFFRRLLGSVQQGAVNRVVGAKFAQILEMASQDSTGQFAYLWLSILTRRMRVEIPVPLHLRGVMGRVPTSSTDVALLIYFLGADVAADRLSQVLTGAGAWPVQPWIVFLKMLPRALGKYRRRIATATLNLLMASGVDLDEITRDRLALRALTGIIEEFGTYTDRTWWWRFVVHRVNLISAAPERRDLSFASQLVGLTERCIGQARSKVALLALRAYLDSPSPRGSISWNRLTEHYSELQLTETEAGLARQAIDALLPLSSLPIKDVAKIAAWTDILRIARHREHGRLLELSESAISQMQSLVAGGVPAHKYSELQIVAVRCFSQCRAMTPELASWMLRWFQVRTRSSWDAQLFVATVSSFAASENPVQRDAQRLLSILPKQGPDTEHHLESFCRSAARYAGLDSCAWPAQILQLSAPFNEYVVGELLLNLQLVPKRWSVPPSFLCTKYARRPRIRGILVTELLRVGAAGEAGEILPTTHADSSPNSLVMRAAIDAVAGDLASAERRMRAALGKYEDSLVGAHPVWVRKAACAMIRHAAPRERRLLALLAQIMTREPLPDVDAALARPHPVSFEPQFF